MTDPVRGPQAARFSGFAEDRASDHLREGSKTETSLKYER
jgi:hypothetical protein